MGEPPVSFEIGLWDRSFVLSKCSRYMSLFLWFAFGLKFWFQKAESFWENIKILQHKVRMSNQDIFFIIRFISTQFWIEEFYSNAEIEVFQNRRFPIMRDNLMCKPFQCFVKPLITRRKSIYQQLNTTYSNLKVNNVMPNLTHKIMTDNITLVRGRYVEGMALLWRMISGLVIIFPLELFNKRAPLPYNWFMIILDFV